MHALKPAGKVCKFATTTFFLYSSPLKLLLKLYEQFKIKKNHLEIVSFIFKHILIIIKKRFKSCYYIIVEVSRNSSTIFFSTNS